MKVKIKKLVPNAVVPTKAHPTDACFDLTATSRTIDEYGNIVYGTGLAFEIPEGYVGKLYPRSSICEYDIDLSNSTGIIDSGYRGEVMAKFKPAVRTFKSDHERCKNIIFSGLPNNSLTAYNVGDRIAQLIIMPLPKIELEEATELSSTDRGIGGYGSSGK